MGLFDKLRGELIDIVEWLDDTNDTLAYRFERYQNEIKYGAKLVVREGQMAAFISRAEKLDLDAAGPSFCDTAGHAFEREIRAVAAAGIAQGNGGCFNPAGPVTRGQMATFLANALSL